MPSATSSDTNLDMVSKSNAVLQKKLADLKALEDSPMDATAIHMLEMALRDRSNLVVARAAEIIGTHQLDSLSTEMTSAYDRLSIDGVKRDPTCSAKVAIAEALRELE
ncbi:MAG: hypothetical protein R3C44_22095, partial [Chloroflexota bacterium]